KIFVAQKAVGVTDRAVDLACERARVEVVRPLGRYSAKRFGELWPHDSSPRKHGVSTIVEKPLEQTRVERKDGAIALDPGGQSLRDLHAARRRIDRRLKQARQRP